MQKILVGEFGCRVIMTTHSPSTVALAPEEAIYTANNQGERIRKTSKDTALKLLTSGVPSFSINYENRRQIFVESKYDVYFYERIYRRIQKHLEPAVSLTFISSGESRTDKHGAPISSCNQVANITSVLRDAGNGFVWGLIDWDAKNNESDFVKVLGENRRYAIENYLFDPLLLGCLLLREKHIERGSIGLNSTEVFTDFKFFNAPRLQTISDFVVREIEKRVAPTAHNRSSHRLINGVEITIPDWYTHMQGHDLEVKVLEAFPSLNGLKKGTEDGLKNAIVDRVIDDVPEIIDEQFAIAFKKLQAI